MSLLKEKATSNISKIILLQKKLMNQLLLKWN